MSSNTAGPGLPDDGRRLAAIMFTDMVGYTSLSQRDEALAIELLEEHRGLVRAFFSKHNGREVKTIGDAFLVEFDSALEAVRCAFDIQQSLHEVNSSRPVERKVLLRVGVHLGDVIHSLLSRSRSSGQARLRENLSGAWRSLNHIEVLRHLVSVIQN